MVMVNLSIDTLAVLISGMYCANNGVNAIAVPRDVWIEIAKKLEHFADNWDYNKLSFEDFIKDNLFIFPKIMLSEKEVQKMMENTLYWEKPNGNVILSISMDIRDINE